MAKYNSIVEIIKQYKGVIFDFDGTLANLKVDWLELKKELATLVKKETGQIITFTPLDAKLLSIKKKYGYDLYTKMLRLVANYEQREKSLDINNEFVDYLKTNKDQLVAIYSTNMFSTIKNFFTVNLIPKPDLIISKEFAIEPKPSEKDLIHILTAWQLKKDEVIFVGNSQYHDGQSGEAAGIRTIIIDKLL